MEKVLLLSDFLVCDNEATILIDEGLEQLFTPSVCDLLFSQNNIIVANIEGPITEKKEPQPKGDSPNIKSNPLILKVLNQIPHLVVSGANNHISDYGEEGIRDTENYLRNNNIPYMGFAVSDEVLCSEHRITIKHQNIVLYSVAQNEFSSIRYNSYGANGYDPLTTFDKIREIKSKADQVIVLFHAGKENYVYPTPEQQRICRKMIASGASLVVCQHSHCIGCEENYLNGKIIYGTGNFYFNISNNPLWDHSIIPNITFDDNGKMRITYTVLHRKEKKITILEGCERDKVLKAFDERSSLIPEASFVMSKWREYCNQNRHYILMKGFSRVPMRFLYRLDSMTGHKLFNLIFRNSERNLTDLNILRCEAISEMAHTILSELCKNQDNKR